MICHDSDYGWWEIEEKLKLAHAKGLNMWSEHYPYDAASTNIGAEGRASENIFPVEDKGRFVPADREQWLDAHTIDTSPIRPRTRK